MSYRPIRNDDTLSELISINNDVVIIGRQLLKYANSPAEFIDWVTKAEQIDRRSTILFLRENFDKFCPSIQRYILSTFQLSSYKDC